MTLLKAVAENSMFVKLHREPATSAPLGCESIFLWSRLVCLMLLATKPRAAQNLRAVSYQQVVGSVYHLGGYSELMMCSGYSRSPSEFPMRVLNDLNGRPKEILFTRCWSPGELRWTKRTLGSTFGLRGRPFMGCSSKPEVDGAPVVQPPVFLGQDGRGVGDSSKKKEDSRRMGEIVVERNVIFLDRTREAAACRVVDRWLKAECLYKIGLSVPRAFAKVLYLGDSNKRSTFHDLYPLMFNTGMLDLAYSQVKSHPGMMTKGVTNETLDGWSADVSLKICASFRDESFRFARSRSVEVPKPKGGTRTLKIAPPRDKVVQRVICNILQAIYEPSFSKSSYGFRPGLGCHDALEHVKLSYLSSRWFIEGDISKCFDEIDHNVLMDILGERIKDVKFLRLIRKALGAGYLDINNVPRNCLVGTPQGSIVSPVLSNILLDKFDSFVVDVLTPQYSRGVVRQVNPAYARALSRSAHNQNRFRATGKVEYRVQAIAFRKIAIGLPSVLVDDPLFRRLRYTRYADDWLIGFAGPFVEAQEIREKCRIFLEGIKLRLSEEKTLITSASKGCIFLGAKVHVPLNQQRFKKGYQRLSRAALGVRLNCPLDRVIRKLALGGFCNASGYPLPKMALYACDKDEMVSLYSSVFRGFINYYSFADNFKILAGSIWYILRNSCCKVLAAKYKTKSVRATLLRFGPRLEKEGIRSLPKLSDPSLRGSIFKRGSGVQSRVKAIFKRASLSIRTDLLICVRCGSTYQVELHHVRMLKNLNKRLDPVSMAMAARNRKQIPLCRHCHVHQHVNLNKIIAGHLASVMESRE